MGACAKRAGAWIEILHVSRAAELGRVAPFTGAWIEINRGNGVGLHFGRRSLHGSVD